MSLNHKTFEYMIRSTDKWSLNKLKRVVSPPQTNLEPSFIQLKNSSTTSHMDLPLFPTIHTCTCQDCGKSTKKSCPLTH